MEWGMLGKIERWERSEEVGGVQRREDQFKDALWERGEEGVGWGIPSFLATERTESILCPSRRWYARRPSLEDAAISQQTGCGIRASTVWQIQLKALNVQWRPIQMRKPLAQNDRVWLLPSLISLSSVDLLAERRTSLTSHPRTRSDSFAFDNSLRIKWWYASLKCHASIRASCCSPSTSNVMFLTWEKDPWFPLLWSNTLRSRWLIRVCLFRGSTSCAFIDFNGSEGIELSRRSAIELIWLAIEELAEKHRLLRGLHARSSRRERNQRETDSLLYRRQNRAWKCNLTHRSYSIFRLGCYIV